MYDQNDILELIDQVLAERGWSARQASIEAIGRPDLVVAMRRGRVPSAARLAALCDVLGLEHYVGRRRTVGHGEFDVDCLALALDAVDTEFSDAARELSLHDRARLLVAVYLLLRGSDPSTGASKVRDLIAIARRFGVSDAVGE